MVIAGLRMDSEKSFNVLWRGSLDLMMEPATLFRSTA